eukprot:jgi/Botrbrau1/4068/Bobra.152_3s0024.1
MAFKVSSSQLVACHSLLLSLFFVGHIRTAFCSRRFLIEDIKDASESIIELPNADHSKVNNRPLIGILTQRDDPARGKDSYIASSYVKFVESAGARAVPIFCDMPAAEVERRFNIVNGFLLPGGSAILRPGHHWFDTAKLMLDLAMDANDRGDYFPVLAICLGFETLSIAISGNTSLLTRYDAEDTAAPLFFTDQAKKSRFFGSMRKEIVEDLASKPYARESHAFGLSLASFDAEPNLKKEFEVLSLSTDPEGNVYISTMESRHYPITATQWHPEKNTFEWGDKLHIPHSRGAIEVTHAAATFFVEQARHNFHKAANILDEDDVLIYNHQVIFSGRHEKLADSPTFDEAYIFPTWEEWNRDHHTQSY